MVNTKRILLFCLTKQKQNNKQNSKKKKSGTFKNKVEKETCAIALWRVAHAGILSGDTKHIYKYAY